jgi:hypothetical protein
MDKRLLQALEHIGDGLEMLVDSLKSQEKPKTSTAQAVQGGDFGKSLEKINMGIQSIKKDTQLLLKNQQTLVTQQKQKSSDKQTELFDQAGDQKKTGQLKKGIATILLIAVAVLAIGLAFKIVGKIDFLSVIGLGLAIVLISVAFEKVSRFGLTIKQAAITSLTLVMMSAAITVSSWILSMISTVSIAKLATGILIAGMFYVMADKLAKIALGVAAFKLARVKAWQIILPLVGISTAITASSWILSQTRVLTFTQSITAIMIAGMFAVISVNFEKIALGVAAFDKYNIKKIVLVTTLVGMAAAITASSWILSLIRPMTFKQSINAILIAAMFMVISFNFEKIAAGVAAFDKLKIKKTVLILTLVGIAAAITASSWILSLIKPMGLMQFLTAIGIAILFAVMSFVMKDLAIGIVLIDKIIGKKAALLIPLTLVTISIAIMLSSHILSKSAKMGFSEILKIILFGVGLGIAVLAILPSVLAVGIVMASGVGAGALALGVLAVPIIALAIMVSSHILAKGKYDKFPSAGWALGVGLSMTLFTTAVLALGVIAITGVGALAILAGLVLVPIVAMAVVLTAAIIRKGKFDKYPGAGWILGVGVSMTGFAAAALTLGVIAITGIGAIALLAGIFFTKKIAQNIVDVSKIIGKGKYDKYPGAGWILSVGVTLTGFGVATVALGVIALTGIGAIAMLAGLFFTKKIAQNVVDVSTILAGGKYDKYPGLAWIASIGVTMTGFAVGVVTLGGIALTGFGLGAVAIWAGTQAVILIAETIVKVDEVMSKGKFDKFPSWNWIGAVGLSMTAFGASMIGLGALILGSLGLGWIVLKTGEEAVLLIAGTVVKAAEVLRKGNFSGGPTKEWAEGIAIALGAFSPIYTMLAANAFWSIFGVGGVTPKQYRSAILVISEGIITAANKFAFNKASFKDGPSKEWAEGISIALSAFSPVYGILVENSGWFKSGISPETYKKAIITISNGIVTAAQYFANNKSKFVEGNYPSKQWGKGVGAAIGAFAPALQVLSGGSWFTSSKKKVESIGEGIRVTARSIVDAAKIFGDAVLGKDAFNPAKAPDKDWGRRVASSISGFGAVFEYMFSQSGLFKSNKSVIRDMVFAVKQMSLGMVTVARNFDNENWKEYPDEKWGSSVRAVMREMSIASENLMARYDDPDDIGWGLYTMSLTIYKVARNLKGGGYNEYPGKNWVSGVIYAMTRFLKFSSHMIMNYPITLSQVWRLEDFAKKMGSVAKALYSAKEAFNYRMPPGYIKSVRKNMLDFQSLIQELVRNEKKGFMELAKDRFFGTGPGTEKDPIIIMVNRMMKLAKGYDALANSLIKLSVAMNLLKIRSPRGLVMFTRDLTGQNRIESEKDKLKKVPGGTRKFGDRTAGKKEDGKEKGGEVVRLTPEQRKKNQIWYLTEQVEQSNRLLMSISSNVITINERMQSEEDGGIFSFADNAIGAVSDFVFG